MVHIKPHVLNYFRFPIFGRDQPSPCSGSRGNGSTAGVLLLQIPVAFAAARYGYVNASSYYRSRPSTRSFGGNIVDINVINFVILVSVTIADVAAAIVVLGAAVSAVCAL